MADQKDRQQHAGISHHLHQPLEAGQRLVVQVMRLVDHQYDRALALAHDVAQVALAALGLLGNLHLGTVTGREIVEQRLDQRGQRGAALVDRKRLGRSEEHTSELQSLMRISYAVCCLKKNNYSYLPNI